MLGFVETNTILISNRINIKCSKLKRADCRKKRRHQDQFYTKVSRFLKNQLRCFISFVVEMRTFIFWNTYTFREKFKRLQTFTLRENPNDVDHQQIDNENFWGLGWASHQGNSHCYQARHFSGASVLYNEMIHSDQGINQISSKEVFSNCFRRMVHLQIDVCLFSRFSRVGFNFEEQSSGIASDPS